MKKYRILQYLTILAVVAGVSFSCKSPTSPSGGTPPDTTSNNFTWTQYTFGGQGGSSYFKDVAIVNDSDIWAVGDIYTGTSDTAFYNAVHWDGKQWTLVRIPQNLYNFDCSLAGSAYGVLLAVFAFKDGNLIFTSGGDFILWNGASFTHLPCPNGAANSGVSKLWGASESDFYAVGRSGFIIHYSDGAWTQLPSGTSLPIQDIWGATDPKTGKEEILAVAGEPTVSFDRAILSIEGMTVNKISDTPISYDLFSVWFVPEKHYYVAGDGIYEKDLLSDSLWTDSVQQITTYYTTCVRGNGVNDVFIAGAFGELLHWDGASWKSFKDQTSLSNGSYSGVAVHGHLVIAVGGNLAAGDIDSKAVVTMGRR